MLILIYIYSYTHTYIHIKRSRHLIGIWGRNSAKII